MSKKDGIEIHDISFSLDDPERLVEQIAETVLNSHRPMEYRLQYLAGLANGVSIVNMALESGEPVDKVTGFAAEVSKMITSIIMDIISERNKRREKGGEA